MRMLRSRLTIALAVAAVGIVAAAGALAQSKSTLIGKLEGPEVVTDPAKFPKTFKEAPQLAEQVKAGKLPPVAERIGQDPLVIKPLHEIGKYGGTWRGGFTGPADFWNGYRCCSGPDHLLFWDYTGDKVTPNIAKGYEMQDGGRTLVLHLRRGMKWSDGKPFTADDFVFWFEDIYRNKDLVPTPSAAMAINGKQGVLEKVDTYTVKFKFPEPYYMLPDVLAGSTDLAGQAWRGAFGLGGYAPAHYLKQFHPKYAGQAEVEKKAKDAKFDSWVRMFFNRSDWSLNPELPVITPWKTVTPINTPTWTLERNPYSVFVDPAGNQLPYIDRVVLTLAENLEVINLRALAGEYAFQARHLQLDKVGLAKKDAEGFRLRTDGKGRLRLEIMTLGGQFLQFTQIAEMIREQWKKIGIDLVVQEVERSLALQRTAANEQQLGAWNNDGSEHLFTFPTHVFPFDTIAVVASSGPLYAKWFQSAGTQGKEPPARMKELMAKFKRAYGVPEKERIQLGKDVWKITAEEVYIIGVIGMGPASMGVRVVKTNMGNIPSRQYNSPDGKTPGISRPITFYWKN